MKVKLIRLEKEKIKNGPNEGDIYFIGTFKEDNPLRTKLYRFAYFVQRTVKDVSSNRYVRQDDEVLKALEKGLIINETYENIGIATVELPPFHFNNNTDKTYTKLEVAVRLSEDGTPIESPQVKAEQLVNALGGFKRLHTADSTGFVAQDAAQGTPF